MSEANNTTIRTISISGLDGSGKSTQVKLLKKYLESQGKRVFYFHAVEFSIGNKIINFLKFKKQGFTYSRSQVSETSFKASSNNSAQRNKSVIQANWLQIQLRKIALRIDIWRFKKLVKKLEKQGYDYILSDRFFYDTIVNISYLENKNLKIVNCKLIENCKLKIENLTSFYLQTSPRNIMNRDRVPDQGLEYLKEKKKLYDAKIKEFNFTVVDGDRDQDMVFKEMVSLIHSNTPLTPTLSRRERGK